MRVRACLWAVSVALVLTGCTGGLTLPFPAPDNTPLEATPAPPPVVLLQVGDCTGPADSGFAAYDQLPKAACNRPHYYEVIALLPLAGEEWPGFDAVSYAAERGCPDAFTGYVGVSAGNSLYTTHGVVPARADWRSPDNRLVACLAGTDGGGLVGSVMGDQTAAVRRAVHRFDPRREAVRDRVLPAPRLRGVRRAGSRRR